MCTGPVTCCPMVSHTEYVLPALLRVEKRCSINVIKKTGQTDRQRMDARLLQYD